MKRFIEKLITELEKEQDNYLHDESDYGEGKYNAYGEQITKIKRLAEEYNNGWIPCSKELPNDLEDETILYEVTVAVDICGKVNYVTDYAIFFDNNWKSATWTKQGGKVIAWKERTKPYIPEK